MSANVTCPHCQGSIQNNPSLAGQAVSCPHCNGQFTMPAIVRAVAPAKPPAPSPANEFDFGSPSRSPVSSTASSRYRKRKKAAVPVWVWIVGGVCAVPLLFCVFATIVGLAVPQETKDQWQAEREAERKRNTLTMDSNGHDWFKASREARLEFINQHNDTPDTYAMHGIFASSVEILEGVNRKYRSGELTYDDRPIMEREAYWLVHDVQREILNREGAERILREKASQ